MKIELNHNELQSLILALKERLAACKERAAVQIPDDPFIRNYFYDEQIKCETLLQKAQTAYNQT